MQKLILFIFSLFLIHCGGSSSPIGPDVQSSSNLPSVQLDPMGKVRVKMHDFPLEGFDVSQVFVTIQRVEIGSDTLGWIVLNEEKQTYDLLELVNNVSVVLGNVTIEAGTYDQIRLILAEENRVIANGESRPLKIPSGEQTGIKLDGPFTIGTGEIVEITLDFDAQKSIHWNRGQGFMLKPVIQIESVVSASGSFAQTTIPSSQGGLITLSDGFQLTIPAGALSQDAQISVEQVTVAPQGSSVYSNEYLLGPSGLQFNVPLKVSLPYFEEALQVKKIPENDLVLMLDHEPISDSIVDTTNNVITGSVAHFSSLRAEDKDQRPTPVFISDVPVLKRAYLPFGYLGRPSPNFTLADPSLVLPDGQGGFASLKELIDPRPDRSSGVRTDYFAATDYPDYPVTQICDAVDTANGQCVSWHIVTEWDVDEITTDLGVALGFGYVDFGDPDTLIDFHTGEDWNEGQGSDDAGEEVYAMGPGKVLYKGTAYGNTLIILHKVPSPGRIGGFENNYEYVASLYAHLDRDGFTLNPFKHETDFVTAYDRIASVGTTGADRWIDKDGDGKNETYVPAYHLHFEIRNEKMLKRVRKLSDGTFQDDPSGDYITLKEEPSYWPASHQPGEGKDFIRENYYDPTEFIKSHTGIVLVDIPDASPNADCPSGFPCHVAIIEIPSPGILVVDLRYAPATGDDDYDLVLRKNDPAKTPYFPRPRCESTADDFNRDERVVLWQALQAGQKFDIEVQHRGNARDPFTCTAPSASGSYDATLDLDTFVHVTATFFPFEDPRLPATNPVSHRSKFFMDVATDDVAFEEIRLLYDFGAVSGPANQVGFFKPNDGVVQAEFIAMLIAAINATIGGTDPCSAESFWFNHYFQAARELGIIGDSCLDPNYIMDGTTAALYIRRAFGNTMTGDPATITRREASRMIADSIRQALDSLYP